MNTLVRLSTLLLTVCTLWSSSVMAETLTGALVSQWIKSQSAVEAFSDKHESTLAPYDANIEQQGSLQDAFKQGVVALKQTGLYGEFEDVIEDYGFDSPEQWSQVGSQIMTAYMALEMKKQGPQMQQMMEQMQAMMNNDQMPAEQKQMMMNAMKQSKNMYESSKDVPQADIDAITPYLPQLRSLGENAEPAMQ